MVSHEPVKEVECPFCDSDIKMPKRLRDDLEVGRKLPVDFAREVEVALEGVLESRFVEPEVPRWFMIAGLVAGGALGGFGWLEPEWWWGALLGALLFAFPVGWISAYLIALRRHTVRRRAVASLRKTPLACPKCDNPTQTPALPGRLDCPVCKLSLAIAPEVVIEDAKARKKRWAEPLEARIGSPSWLRGGHWTRAEIALIAGVEVALLAVAIATRWLLQ